ncbi:MAG: MFS transporter [Candidatus Actinomarinales bacterium]|nr:MAG: MFS transporter [Candidatus Actinomarinales bacterium]
MTEKNNKRTLFGWSMYDWAKSAYETTTLGAIMPVYFVSVVVPEEGFNFRGNLYTGAEVWGFAIGSALFIFFLIMPTIGAVADLSGSRMRLFKSFAYGGAIFASTFYFATSGDVVLTLLIYFLAQFGATGSNVFYDSVLKDITTEETIDKVSAKGYALGYLGGGFQLLLSLVIIQIGPGMLGIDTALASRIAIAFAGIWWLIFSIFSFSRMKIDEKKPEKNEKISYLSAGWKTNINTLKKIRKFPFLLYFLLAYIFYWDGAQTVINMAGPFFSEVLLLDQTSIIVVYLIVQFIAFAGARLAGYLAGRIGQKNTLLFTILLFFLAGNGAYFVPEKQLIPVIVLGIIVGTGMGGLQAVSRSVYATMLPKGAEGEFMGFFSVISRFSAIWGPLIYSYVSVSTGNPRLSLPGISLFFVIGFLLLRRVDINSQISEEEWKLAN